MSDNTRLTNSDPVSKLANGDWEIDKYFIDIYILIKEKMLPKEGKESEQHFLNASKEGSERSGNCLRGKSE